MKAESIQLLRNPKNGERLELVSQAVGQPEQLRGVDTGELVPLWNGIPDFINGVEMGGQNQKYQELYNRLAPLYDFFTETYALIKSGGNRARVMDYLKELEIRDGNKVLETSIGTGRSLAYLPSSVSYYGIDISRGMLRRCQEKARQRQWDAELFLCPAESLCFQDEVFDVVYHVGGINYFNDRAAAVREMIRVAKPGSKLIIVDETEELANKYKKTPVAGDFYNNRQIKITSPIDLVPANMQEVQLKFVSGGDLYCLSFRKPSR
jgi:ubiquinone/menaquinone biosynthesis C-methylase UbiE